MPEMDARHLCDGEGLSFPPMIQMIDAVRSRKYFSIPLPLLDFQIFKNIKTPFFTFLV